MDDRLRNFDLVVVVASLGGLRAFRQVLRALPADFPAPVILLQHHAPDEQQMLTSLLAPYSTLPVVRADGAEQLLGGTVYVTGSRHVTIGPGGRVEAFRGDKLGFERPSADVLLRSAAAWAGGRTLAVILTGRGKDGTLGCRCVREAGGTILIQDPATSEAWGMPASVHDAGLADYIVPLEQMGTFITSLVMIPGMVEHLGRVTPSRAS